MAKQEDFSYAEYAPAEEHKPAEEEHKPAEEEHKPAEEEHKPAEEEHKPAEEEHKPAEEEHKPAQEHKALGCKVLNFTEFSYSILNRGALLNDSIVFATNFEYDFKTKEFKERPWTRSDMTWMSITRIISYPLWARVAITPTDYLFFKNCGSIMDLIVVSEDPAVKP